LCYNSNMSHDRPSPRERLQAVKERIAAERAAQESSIKWQKEHARAHREAVAHRVAKACEAIHTFHRLTLAFQLPGETLSGHHAKGWVIGSSKKVDDCYDAQVEVTYSIVLMENGKLMTLTSGPKDYVGHGGNRYDRPMSVRRAFARNSPILSDDRFRSALLSIPRRLPNLADMYGLPWPQEG
jgi:hypothetical protein